ncbi:hypothetical protein ACROYT_G044395 [Oculina patagonica]
MANYHTPPKKMKYGCTSSPTTPGSSPKTTFTGYIQNVTQAQKSQKSANCYFDIDLQTSEDDVKSIRVMTQIGDGSKRKLFVDKLTAQQLVKITNLQLASSGTIFLNNGAAIEDVTPHSMPFRFCPPPERQETKISSLNKCSSGVFVVSGSIQWKGPIQKPSEDSNKEVRDALLTDSTGSITLSIWGEHINQVTEGNFYTFTACKLRHFYGKCLATTRSTTISQAKEQELSSAPQQLNTWLCCPDTLNVAINAYPVCNNKACKKKVSGNPGCRVIKCLSCNRSMLLKNCYLEMNVNIDLEKEQRPYNVTVFRKVINEFLGEDIFAYKDDTQTLIEKLLLLECVDYQLSTSSKLVTKMKSHQSEDDTKKTECTTVLEH